MEQHFTAADVTIVTVSYNSADILLQMLRSVPAETPVVIVNNAGHDLKKLQKIAVDRAGTHIIDNKTNVGFGTACNRGVRAVQTEFVLMLHPDSQLNPETLKTLIAAAGRHKPDTAFNPRIEAAM